MVEVELSVAGMVVVGADVVESGEERLESLEVLQGGVLRVSQRHPVLERLSVVCRGRFRAGRGRSGIRSRSQENRSR